MPKYSFEFKKKIVESYLRGEGGYTYLAEKYGVVYYSYEELKAEIERYIKYYNEQRIKEN
jgi:Mrp family chromosome partitioning ATPase